MTKLRKRKRNQYENSLYKRAAGCFFTVILLMFIPSLRMVELSRNDYAEVARSQSSIILNITRPRGTIFDVNLNPLVNRTTTYIAAVAPIPEAIIALKTALPNADLTAELKRLEGKKPVAVVVPAPIDANGITMFSVLNRYDEEVGAVHVLGYIDGTGHGVSGIEKSFDNILYSETTLRIVYPIDAAGNILPGVDPEIEGDAGYGGNGVALTINKDIQDVVEKSVTGLSAGAALVMEVGTGKIRAMASFPDFDPANPADSLKEENAPMINRTLSAYNVGSVFKPCVAAAALEKKISSEETYICTGSAFIGDRWFACLDSHGEMDLKSALTKSCNTYFYQLAAKTGADSIYRMAQSLGFGQPRRLSDGIVSDKGALPQLDALSRQPSALANFAIGQGDLMLSPLSLAALYEAIAGDGTSHAPTLIEGEVVNGKIVKAESDVAPTRVMKESTASQLRGYLINVVESGTGAVAKPESGGAGGKTATAETGWEKDGRRVVHAWFCGFYPAESPKYVVVVLAEDGVGGGSTCGPVFKSIVDGISLIKQN